MKKILFPIVCIILILLSGCGKKAEEVTTEFSDESALLSETVSTATFTLHLQMTDEQGEAISADALNIQTKEGQSFDAAVSQGECSLLLPVTQGMAGTLTAGTSRVGTFGLSLWTGYTLGYHNNLSFMSIDVPGNTSDLYLKATVCKDINKVYCTYVSTVSFDEAELPPELQGVEIDEETAVSAGLYGIKYAATTGLNLRSQPSSESSSVMKLNFGDQLNLMNSGEEVDGVMWYKVLVDGEKEGYVSGEYVGKKYTITKNGVNIRTSPSTDGEVVNMIGAGSVVIAMDEGTQDGDYKWYYIMTRAGLKGYVRNDFMTIT